MLVRGPSMVPTLRDGDRLLVRWGGAVRPGALVVVRRPEPVGLTVKRAVRRAGGGWWVEGDNPFASADSRGHGPVSDADVVGRVLWRYWPPRR
ncbi:MAG: nickel-type superoxide dismutase maturation protease [Frankiaceae bacterium]